MARMAFIFLSTALVVVACNPERPGAVLILAAASTKDAVEEAGRVFQGETGIEVRVSVGPSNALAEQLLAGAPGDLFLSASGEWAEKVAESGRSDKSVPLLGNRLVIVTPVGNPARVHGPLDLLKPQTGYVALAGENAPAGKYAEQALRAAGVFEPLRDRRRIVYGQDVRVTLGYVELGEARAGVVYATDARISKHTEIVHTFEPGAADAIEYPLVLLKRERAGEGPGRLYAFLTSERGGAIFRRFGFTHRGGP